MEQKVLYFGYGANREPRMMAAITGDQNLKGTPAVLEGYTLCIQRLDQVPESPRQILRHSGQPETFESYVAIRDKKGKIFGTVWELTPQQRELVRRWELVGDWQKEGKGKATLKNGKKNDVVTEVLGEGQKIDREVRTESYNPWLNSPDDFQRTTDIYFKREPNVGEKFLFFGYGPARDLRVMQALTGNKNLVGREAVLKGYRLNLQTLEQVPNTRTLAPKSPREILKESWPDGFEFFVVSPDEKGEVAGTIYWLTAQEKELFRDFELIDLSWNKDGNGKVITSDGQELEVGVPVLGDGQEVNREVDGINYNPYFNSTLEKFVQVAEKSRRELLERMGPVPIEAKS